MPNILDVLGPIIAGQQPGGAMPGALPAEDPAQAAAGQAIGAAGFAGQQQQEEAPKIKAYDQGKGPRVQIDATQEQYQQVVQAAQNYQKIMQGFAAENFARAQQIKQNPWANIATTIAGNMAQYDKNMPGWVRGLGASSRALNPTPQELIAQGAQYEQAGMEPMEKAAGLMQGQARLGMEQARLDLETTTHLATMEHQIRQDQQKVVNDYSDKADKGIKADPKQMATDLMRLGLAKTQEEALSAVTDQHRAALAAQEADRQKRQMLSKEQYDLFKKEEGERRKTEIAKEAFRIKFEGVKDQYTRGRIDLTQKWQAAKEAAKEVAKTDPQVAAMKDFPKTLDELGKLAETKEYFREMQKIADGPLAGYTGPWNIARVRQWAPFKFLEPGQQQYVETFFGHEAPRAADFAKMGVRFASPGYREILDKLLAKQAMTPDQIRAVVKVVYDGITRRQIAQVQKFPKLKWEENYAALLDDETGQVFGALNAARAANVPSGGKITVTQEEIDAAKKAMGQ